MKKLWIGFFMCFLSLYLQVSAASEAGVRGLDSSLRIYGIARRSGAIRRPVKLSAASVFSVALHAVPPSGLVQASKKLSVRKCFLEDASDDCDEEIIELLAQTNKILAQTELYMKKYYKNPGSTGAVRLAAVVEEESLDFHVSDVSDGESDVASYEYSESEDEKTVAASAHEVVHPKTAATAIQCAIRCFLAKKYKKKLAQAACQEDHYDRMNFALARIGADLWNQDHQPYAPDPAKPDELVDCRVSVPAFTEANFESWKKSGELVVVDHEDDV